MSPCDICLEKKCPTNGKCNCETCKVKDNCPKHAGLSATIRITTKCTQSCKHCCFDCSPESKDMMTIPMAKKIATFIKANGIKRANLMGGEIFCNPEYKEILSEIIPSVGIARIVSNSDWVEHDSTFPKFISQFKNVYFALSNDKFHTNKHVDQAEKILKEKKIFVKTDFFDKKDDYIVPIGRSMYEYNFYSTMSCYCHNPEHQYSFLIDEIGKIYKCGFGVWDYAKVEEYLKGGFRERFKEFSKVFYDIFIPNCASCMRGYGLR